MKHLWIFLVSIVPFTAQSACDYAFNPQDVKVHWTAFKTTQKTPVKGQLKKIEIQGKTEGKSFSEILSSLNITADLTQSDSGDPVRDDNIRQFFSKKILDFHKVGAHIKNVKKDSLELFLTLNQKTLMAKLKHSYSEKEGVWKAEGALDLLKFGLKDALGSLNQACFELHKGPDKISKTWPEILLTLETKVTKICH